MDRLVRKSADRFLGFHRQKLLLLGHGENSIYTIDMELKKQYANEFEIVPIIADVQDRELIFDLMSRVSDRMWCIMRLRISMCR